jgi:sugar O-acyltransferase (sialic acid O-acetyltransferase NeuD family)
MKDLAIYGFGGFGREIATLIKRINELQPTWNLIGFFDDGVEAGAENRYGKVLGNIDALNSYRAELSVAIAIGSPKHIENVVSKITNPLIDFPNILAPNVNVFDEDAFSIGKGNIIFWGCRLSCDVSIGDFNMLNGAVSLGHDVKLGDFNVLSPSVRLSGDCTVGDRNFFGIQSMVLQGLKIGNKTRVGACSVVMRNTEDDYLYFGNPAKKMTEI